MIINKRLVPSVDPRPACDELGVTLGNKAAVIACKRGLLILTEDFFFVA